jgi:hypothetical protein
MRDGEVLTVPVDADSIVEARRKALVGQETGSRAGTPVLDRPSQSATPRFRTKLPGEDLNDYLRARNANEGRGSTAPPDRAYNPEGPGFRDRWNINPDLNEDSFTSFVGGIDSNYDPSAYGIQNRYVNIPNPVSADLDNQLAYANSQGNQGFGIDPVYKEQYDPLGGAGFDSNRLNGGGSPVGYNPTPGVYNEFDEAAEIERFKRESMSNRVVGDLDNQLAYANSQANTGATIDMDELDRLDAQRASRESQRKFDEEQARAKQASLVSGPVRSWDSKLADITANADGTVTLPTDMWRNAGRSGGSLTIATDDKVIGREQLEDAIRKIAELGGRDNLNSNVARMLQDARKYYSSTDRGRNTWGKNIDSGLIDGKLIYDDAFKATWGSLADEVLGARKADVESQIPDGWANNPSGFESLHATQQKDAIDNNLNSMEEVEDFYTAAQANQLESVADAEDLYDVGEGVGLDEELPEFTTKGFAVDDPVIDPFYGETVDPNALGAGQLGPGEGGNYDQTIPAVPPPQVFGPQPPPPAGAGGSFPALSSQELINDPQGYLTAAGQRLAFKNVYGDAATGVGPLASYLQRQTFPLTNAYRGSSFANMAREQAGGVAPQVSFEDFLRTTRNQPSGLSGTYGQTLQDVNYLRGLGGGQVPVGLEGVFNPEQAANTRDARNLLQAAQRGKYSGLVSSAFRRPTEDDLFSDYVLSRQDATTAGTAPQNFLNFAASRYGL